MEVCFWSLIDDNSLNSTLNQLLFFQWLVTWEAPNPALTSDDQVSGFMYMCYQVRVIFFFLST